MSSRKSGFPSRTQLALLLACTAALIVDVATGLAGVTTAIVAIKLGMSGVKIPDWGMVLITTGSWAFNYRMALVAVTFVIALGIALIRLKRESE